MSRHQHIIANDNAPLRQPLISNSFRATKVVSTQKAENPIKAYKIKTFVFWMAPLLSVCFGLYALSQNLPLSVLFWPSVAIGTVLLFTAAKAEPKSRLRNVCGLLMVAAITIGLAAFLAQNGFTLVAMELAFLVSILALLSGWIFRSEPSVLLSTFAGLFYLASSFPELGLTTGLANQTSQLGGGLLPLVILGQIVLAQKVKSTAVLFAALVTAYVWFGTFAKDMPLAALTGLSFAVAAAHYWLSKAWSETNMFGANVHRVCAWVIAMGAALYVQSLWLDTNAGQATPFWPPNTLWWAVLGGAMFALFVASLMRYKTSHISLLGIFIICSAVVVLPLATAKPDIIHAAFDAVPGLNARPGLGLVIGAIIIASGFIWMVSGLKHGRLLDMSIGALAIGIEVMVLFQPARFDADLGVIFVVSLICALCTGGLIAGASPDRNHARGDYA